MKTTRTAEQNDAVVALTKLVAKIDRIWAKDSKAVRIERRAATIDAVAGAREAAYSLSWLVDTGRLSAEQEAQILGMSPRRFAVRAVEIASTPACVSDRADMWRAA